MLLSHSRSLETRARSCLRAKPLTVSLNPTEPSISREIMRLHHTGHHQAYVNNLNKATEQLAQAFAARDLKMELELQSQLKFNGGGHINHVSASRR